MFSGYHFTLLDHYQYKPLRTDREIGVFTLYNDPFDSGVRGHLEHVSLDARPVYQALSYVWGSTARDVAILCNETTLHVPRSLYEALKQLRLNPEGPEQHLSKVIWADALCIDQADSKERTQQVRIMDQIYRQAALVDVWLGLSSADSDLAMLFTAELVNILMPLQHENAGDLAQVKIYGRYGVRSKNDDAWYALSRLLVRPWFTRAWVVQEVAMCSKVQVHCGATSLDWACFSALITLCTRFQITLQRGFNATGRETGEGLVMFEAMRKRVQKAEKLNLVSLLLTMRYLESSKPEDKIFAALGLATDSATYLSNIDCDYTAAQIFRGVAESMVSKGDTLEMLSQVRHPRRVAPLPSWVPDWSFDKSLVQEGLPYYVVLRHAAAGNTTPTVRLSQVAGVLHISGCVVDEVMHLSSCLQFSGSKPEIQKTYLSWDRECRGLVNSLTQYPTGQSVKEAHWRTRISNLSQTFETADHSYGTSYVAWHEYCEMAEDFFAGRSIDTVKFAQLEVMAEPFATVQTHSVLRRRFCVTRKGYFGITPSDTQVGDFICIFAGGSVPFVIRKAGARYMLLGECYIHGLMQGQALQNPGFRFQELSLI